MRGPKSRAGKERPLEKREQAGASRAPTPTKKIRGPVLLEANNAQSEDNTQGEQRNWLSKVILAGPIKWPLRVIKVKNADSWGK